MSAIILVGAGGFGLEVAAYTEDMLRPTPSPHPIKGFLDDTKPRGSRHAGYPVLGPTDSPVDADALYVIAVGAPDARRKLAEALSAKGARFLTVRHPSAFCAATATVGEGSIIAPFAFVGPEAVVGKHGLLNIYASAGHESAMGDYSVLSPYATLHGSSRLGDRVFVGSYACVTARIEVGSGAVLAAGSVAYHNIPPETRVMGNPASFRQK